MHSIRFTVALVVAGAGIAGLSGCLASPVPPRETATFTAPARQPSPIRTPTPTPRPTATLLGEATDCHGEPLTINGSDQRRTVTGTCPALEIDGNGVTVTLVDATVEGVVIRGDRVVVDGGELGSVSIGGQDNRVDAVALGSLEIRGDRNLIDVEGRLGAVAIGGNDNGVTGSTVGEVTVDGDRNQVGSR